MVTRLKDVLRNMCKNKLDQNDHSSNSGCMNRGECFNGSCICEIRFSGVDCESYNSSYHAGVSSVFYVVAFISFVQLMICCVAEYQRLKQPSFLRACRITTQKFLYFIVFLAAILRGAYFTTPEQMQPAWAYYLMSAYYPLLMTCFSLIVCFWAEIFHLRDIRWERQFLSKSFLGFMAFNLLPYSLFVAEILSAKFFNDRNVLHSIFNGCYALLFLIVVIFFLIYGVEVFFKIRGGFVYEYGMPPSSAENVNVNLSQVHQSRFGLLSQAVMCIVIVGFLTSETLGDFWKQKVPVVSRNWYDIIFRLVEAGVGLWFQACLWNAMAPEQLWILNPRKLLTRQIDPVASTSKASTNEENQSLLVCWVCYDQDKIEPLIQPCQCTGDVSSVHHECLRRWLVESIKDEESDLKCKVCGSPYEVRRTNKFYWDRGFDVQHWTKTIILISLMCITGVLAWVIIQLYVNPIVRVLTAGFAIIIGYVCVKLLGENTVNAYQRAVVGSIKIVASNKQLPINVNTICQDIEIDRR